MSTLSPQAQAVLDGFVWQSGVTPKHLHRLTTAIHASPAVVDEMNSLVEAGHLKAIAPLGSHGFHAGGAYDDRGQADTLRLPLAALEPNEEHRDFDRWDVTFVVGHELQHGLNYQERQQAYAAFDRALQTKLATPAPRDYTEAVSAFIGERRRDEASSQIAGWNAVVSALRKGHEMNDESLTLKEIFHKDSYRMADFISRSDASPHTYSMKPGLTIEPDFTLRATPANVEAMGKHFFDKPAKQTDLGRSGQSDYSNYYGAYALARIAQLEQFYHRTEQDPYKAHVALNLPQLHLSPRMIEKNGIDMGSHQTQLLVLDSSRQLPVLYAIANTGSAPTLVPEADRGEPGRRVADASLRGMPAGDRLYDELRQRLPPETSPDRLAQITLAARVGGIEAGQLRRIDVQGDRLFLTGTIPGMRNVVDLATPPPSPQESLQQLHGIQQQAQQHNQQQSQQAQQVQQASGPVMTLMRSPGGGP